MTSLVFLSHRSVDKPRLRSFVLRLIDRRVPVWIDNPDEFNVDLPRHEPRIEGRKFAGVIDEGTEWPKSIDEALMRASVFVVFWSNAWVRDRVILAHEHGVALARSRAGTARYFPVFLDDELSDDLRSYRAEIHDDYQAFNLARYGHSHWNRLLEAICEASNLPHLGGVDRNSRREGPKDWDKIFEAQDRDDDELLSCLLSIPEGAAVDSFTVTVEIKQRFARATTPTTARGIVGRASSAVLRSLATEPTNTQAFVVGAYDLRAPELGLSDFWASAFDEACMLGPRMVAALLLSAPTAAVRGAEAKFAEVMRRLGDGHE